MINMTREEKVDFAEAVVNALSTKSNFEGTATQLMRKVSKSLPSDLKTKSASIFRQRFNESLKVIRSLGVSVKFTQTSGNNSKKLIILSA